MAALRPQGSPTAAPARPRPAAAARTALRYCSQPVQTTAPLRPQRAARPCRPRYWRAARSGWTAPSSPTTASRRATACPPPGTAAPADIGAVDNAFEDWASARHRPAASSACRSRATPWCASASIRRMVRGPTWAATCSTPRGPRQRTMNFGWAADHRLRPRHRAARDRPHAGPRARAPEPERRHQLERAGGARLLQGAAQQLGASRRSNGTSCARSRWPRSRAPTWDPDSVMEYQFEAGLIQAPDQVQATGLAPKGGLSSADKTWVVESYPGAKPPAVERSSRSGLSQLLKLARPARRGSSTSRRRARAATTSAPSAPPTPCWCSSRSRRDRQCADRRQRRQRHRHSTRSVHHAPAEGPPLPDRRAALLRRRGRGNLD